MRVLIADDSAFIRDRLQEMLIPFGQVEIVGSYTNGTDALEALQSLNPDLAIMDIKMPGMNGLEVLKEIRTKNKTMQFIILTFHATDFHRRTAMESGADYFFSKVDEFEKIGGVVNEILQLNLEQLIKIKS